uniref:Integrase catalytic domain-containing protein n=1 Tax=Chromera velia CCMP2878 TaxID=1169474 RepID=A0A0G4H7T7_9ALVE|eukprot:Cvel_25000.t1-p1 / transcript=Cvel_25000.t1 / gene=Cvel_25000 / organism=Chromera_velia_CCMP2878 / gene_product=Putative transposon Ty5-1 protein YCL074W, putative / transcript_product=Putative transposon Ty5-1 protein YCL074W, putative / location=Cvel_scaffold2771:8384-12934(-) / protein_length=1517 / sequence_SO=supercontig / SO=protein_coding / is_pseudo=false
MCCEHAPLIAGVDDEISSFASDDESVFGSPEGAPDTPFQVSDDFAWDYLQYIHQEVGHIGGRSLYSLVSSYIRSPRLRALCAKLRQDCGTCLKVHGLPRRFQGQQGRHFKTPIPFQHVAVDTIFVRNVPYLTMMCESTFFFMAARLPDTKSSSAWEAFHSTWVRVFGVPASFHGFIKSDGGSEFKKTFAARLTQIGCTRHLWTPPGRPQANGLLEHRHDDLKRMIEALLVDEQFTNAQLDDVVARAVAQLNALPACQGDKKSPFERVTNHRLLPPSLECLIEDLKHAGPRATAPLGLKVGDRVYWKHPRKKFRSLELKWKLYEVTQLVPRSQFLVYLTPISPSGTRLESRQYLAHSSCFVRAPSCPLPPPVQPVPPADRSSSPSPIHSQPVSQSPDPADQSDSKEKEDAELRALFNELGLGSQISDDSPAPSLPSLPNKSDLSAVSAQASASPPGDPPRGSGLIRDPEPFEGNRPLSFFDSESDQRSRHRFEADSEHDDFFFFAAPPSCPPPYPLSRSRRTRTIDRQTASQALLWAGSSPSSLFDPTSHSFCLWVDYENEMYLLGEEQQIKVWLNEGTHEVVEKAPGAPHLMHVWGTYGRGDLGKRIYSPQFVRGDGRIRCTVTPLLDCTPDLREVPANAVRVTGIKLDQRRRLTEDSRERIRSMIGSKSIETLGIKEGHHMQPLVSDLEFWLREDLKLNPDLKVKDARTAPSNASTTLPEGPGPPSVHSSSSAVSEGPGPPDLPSSASASDGSDRQQEVRSVPPPVSLFTNHCSYQPPINSRDPPVTHSFFAFDGEQRDVGFEVKELLLMAAGVTHLPVKYKQLSSQQWDALFAARKKELEKFSESGFDVFEPVPVAEVEPEKAIILQTLWVDTLKLDDDGNRFFKSRWVCRGDKDPRVGLDVSTESCPAESIRLMVLASLSSEGFEEDWIAGTDVDNAFLQSDMLSTVPVYVFPPREHADHGKKLWRLKKAMYGLREAPLCFEKYLQKRLKSLGWEMSPLRGIWWKLHPDTHRPLALMAVYVDDLVVASLSGPAAPFLQEIRSVVKCKETKPMGRFVGINYEFGSVDGEPYCFCSQEGYTESLPSSDAAVPQLPVPVSFKRRKDISNELPASRVKSFQEELGMLNYLASSTRPDIAFGCSTVSQWNATPTERAQHVLKRLTAYAKEHKKRGLMILPVRTLADLHLEVHSHASFGLQLGWVFLMRGCPLIWKLVKPTRVARSTSAAETLAAAEELDLLSEVLPFYSRIWPNVHRTIWTDSDDLVKNMNKRHPTPAQKSLGQVVKELREQHNIRVPGEKHDELLSVAATALGQELQENHVAMCHIPTANQLADPLTKPIADHPLYSLLEKENHDARLAASRSVPPLHLRPLLQDPGLQAEAEVFFKNVAAVMHSLSVYCPSYDFSLPDRVIRDASLVPSNALAMRAFSLEFICSECRCLGHRSLNCPDVSARRKGTYDQNCRISRTTGKFCTWCEGVGLRRPGHRKSDHVASETKPTVPHEPVRPRAAGPLLCPLIV